MSLNRFSSRLFHFTKRSLLNRFSIRQDSYKAAVLEKANEPLEIESVKPKKLKKGQVRIKVRCCAVNASDFLLTQGVNPSSFPLPIVPGYELSGVVLETKDCDSFSKGEKVVALNKDNLGGFAEECIVDEKDVWPAPSSLGFESSAALPDSFATALIGLSRMGHLSEKQVVIVTMAPAHGYAPLTLAASVYKTKVIAVTMTEEEAEGMRERGAWSALSYDESRLQSKVKELTNGKGVDIVYDTLAGDVLKTCMKCVAHEGHILVAGYTLKELPKLGISQLLSLPSFYLSGVSLKSYRKHAFQTYRQAVSDVLEMSEEKLIKPEVAKSFPLEEVNKAIEFIKDKKPIGKIIIETSK